MARVLSGRSQLPSKEAMSADVTAFYELLEANHVPIRYAHNQSDAMPENQWAYNDSLAEACGPDVPLLPQWRRQLHSTLTSTIFEKPETFRDEWSEEEKSAFAVAAKACQELLEEYNSNRYCLRRPAFSWKLCNWRRRHPRARQCRCAYHANSKLPVFIREGP